MALHIDRSRTALVLVDPYNDFLSEGGKVWPRVKDVAEELDTNGHLRELIGAVRDAGMRVFYAPHRRWRPGDTDGWKRPGRPHAGMREVRAFALGTWGGEFAPGLEPQERDVVCSEHWTENGFVYTDLDFLLRQHDIAHILLAGMTAPGCVEGTGRFAVESGYIVTVVRDATAAYTLEMLAAAHEQTGRLWANEILDTADVIGSLADRS